MRPRHFQLLTTHEDFFLSFFHQSPELEILKNLVAELLLGH